MFYSDENSFILLEAEKDELQETKLATERDGKNEESQSYTCYQQRIFTTIMHHTLK